MPLRLPVTPVGDAHSVIKSDYPFWHCCYAVEIKLLLKAASLLLVKLRAKSPSEGFYWAHNRLYLARSRVIAVSRCLFCFHFKPALGLHSVKCRSAPAVGRFGACMLLKSWLF